MGSGQISHVIAKARFKQRNLFLVQSLHIVWVDLSKLFHKLQLSIQKIGKSWPKRLLHICRNYRLVFNHTDINITKGLHVLGESLLFLLEETDKAFHSMTPKTLSPCPLCRFFPM